MAEHASGIRRQRLNSIYIDTTLTRKWHLYVHPQTSVYAVEPWELTFPAPTSPKSKESKSCIPRCHSREIFGPSHSCEQDSTRPSISTKSPPATNIHFPFMSLPAAMTMALAMSWGEFNGNCDAVHLSRSLDEVNAVLVSHGAIPEICEWREGNRCEAARKNPTIWEN
jgi:hypothetical protein